MYITEEQRAILDGLYCVRLSSHPHAMRLVEDFSNPKNEVLVDYIQGNAFEEDSTGKQ